MPDKQTPEPDIWSLPDPILFLAIIAIGVVAIALMALEELLSLFKKNRPCPVCGDTGNAGTMCYYCGGDQ